MSQSDIMGGGDDFQARLRAEKERRARKEERKQEEMHARVSAHEQAEKEKMDTLKAMLGLTDGVRYQIPKRQ